MSAEAHAVDRDRETEHPVTHGIEQTPVHDDAEYRHHIRTYIKVAVVLAIVTAIEVFLSYMHFFVAAPNWLIALLMILGMIIKFALVALYFMHLKGDSPALYRFFVVGIVGAIVLYLGMLLAYNVFTRPLPLP